MSVVDDLSHLAAGRGLGVVASLLSRFATPSIFEPAPANDPRLALPPHEGTDEILGQLVRRGFDPRLVKALLDKLAGCPLERALVAKDVLDGALYPPGSPLVRELRDALRVLAPALPQIPQIPKPGRAVDLNAHPAKDLVARFAGVASLASASEVELLSLAHQHRLAALFELSRRGDPLPSTQGAVDSLRAFAGLAHLAHLPSLASVLLDYLTRGLGVRACALDLCEVLFDAQAPDKIPGDAIRPGDLPAAQLSDAGEYLVYRSWLALGDFKKAHALLEQNLAARDPRLPPPSARLVAMRAHLSALSGKRPIQLAVVEKICEADRLWRYGSRARLVVAATQAPLDSSRPYQLLHDFLAAFGFDFATFTEALLAAPPTAAWRKESMRLLARELSALPHDPSLWRLLLMVIGDPRDIERGAQEIDERLRAQML